MSLIGFGASLPIFQKKFTYFYYKETLYKCLYKWSKKY